MGNTNDFLDDLEIEDLGEDTSPGRNGKKRRKERGSALLIPLVVSGVLLVILVGMLLWGTQYADRLRSTAGDGKDPATGITGEQILEEDPKSPNVSEENPNPDETMEEEKLLAQLEGRENVLDFIRQNISDGVSVLETLKPLYEDYLLVASSGRYHFVPIDRSLRMNNYSQENLRVLDNGEIQYVSNENIVSYKGIDVSKFQGNINWKQVKEDGVEFAFIRVGYRGYGTKGTLVTDEKAEDNIKGANEAGVKVGVYFYTQAITTEEAVEEAELVLDLIAPYKIECPVVIDVEKVTSGDGRMNKLDPQTRTDVIKAFCERVREAGYRPMIYHNLECAAMMICVDQLQEYDTWFAYYRPEMYYPYDYKIWQYSDKGTVKGIQGAVDLDIAFEPIWIAP